MARPVQVDLMDDLAYQVHDFLLKEAVPFNGGFVVFIPVTELAKHFQKNHRTITRRLFALKDAKLLGPLIQKTYGTLYWVKEEEED